MSVYKSLFRTTAQVFNKRNFTQPEESARTIDNEKLLNEGQLSKQNDDFARREHGKKRNGKGRSISKRRYPRQVITSGRTRQRDFTLPLVSLVKVSRKSRTLNFFLSLNCC